ncbi:metabolite traffic protein EboE [Aetokthonos hydrillicola Thurmond2011]|jgi:hypothetical protein|uniref:Metabolite traffic protein EboE n=1 Tax=Aetokthonos hydrillicola Thurmond2011 TaxID=2712845 RepID=A0AAP5I7G4_9CYAN|nr:metabolite traffic protein EboE [Aetokthonos hydrillicola]MBO3458965.1 metabolite traffic protein EboE [Aetokthonos hydrillicola CCALA 1050]MBW4589072.1 metabolite traffic protein EboE [Aetokthonos hydrillicola CCALA 1050]MDR9894972.1 metabolite traffic protein EboE [Aetokthonos hydrillicola Thurmond2011]
MKIDKNLHLTYCTNIHPGEEWSQVFTNLKRYIPELKARLTTDKPFGIGLRLADVATRELLQGNTLAEFQLWLKVHNLYVFTLNGFPYGGFHGQVVKDQVYAPDWSKQERLDYTLRLVDILAKLLPAGMDGSISTLPLSYKPWLQENQTLRKSIANTASLHIAQVVAQMVRIRIDTEKLLHLDLEPEPDGLIENAAEVVDYFETHLLPIGGSYLAEHLAIPLEAAQTLLREHVRICYDTCHFAVGYEDPVSVFREFQAAQIQIGKIQISAALRVNIPSNIKERTQIKERLQDFAESTYLHQVVARDRNGQLLHYPDLEIALPNLEHTTDSEWRIHFHVPIFIHDYQLLQSTQDDIVTMLQLVRSHNISKHLEIETYTWDVLPQQMKLDLLASIEREYDWILKKNSGVRIQESEW